jgi:uncharacterized protein (TIRG00374 family)
MNRRFALIQILCSLIALAAVVWWATKQKTPTLPQDGSAVRWLVIGVLIYAVATLLRAERWHRILHITGVDAHRSDSYALTTVGYMGNNVLPARAGEMLRVMLLSPRTDAGKRELLGTVVAERALDAVALAGIFVVVAYGILRNSVLASDRPLLVLATALALVLLGLLVLQIMRKRGMLERARDFLRPMAGATRALLNRRGAVLLAASVVIWSAEASVYWSVAHATGLHVSHLGSLYLMAFTNLVAMIPAAPGYLGTFDAAVVIGVRAIGGTKGAALPYLLLLRFVLFVPITAVGLLMLVTRYGGWSRLKAATRLEARSA